MLRTISRMMSRAGAGLAAAGRSIEEPASILTVRGGAGFSLPTHWAFLTQRNPILKCEPRSGTVELSQRPAGSSLFSTNDSPRIMNHGSSDIGRAHLYT